jgi:hypothetical protein
MADVKSIRRALAANLRTVPDCTVSPYLLPEPLKPVLQVAAFETIEYLEGGFGELARDRGASLLVIIEGAAGAANSRSAYELFDQWLLWQVPEAIESDTRLTSRLKNDGSILVDQDPVSEALQVREFRGYRATRIPASGADVLIGDWVVEVHTSG